MASTIKARKHGFDCCADSEEMFSRLLSEMADARLIPALEPTKCTPWKEISVTVPGVPM